ncbi:MAG: hypothetical protein ACRDV9_08950 [Acidimicrobiia bacterium]
MGDYNPAMQKANFSGPGVEVEEIGRIAKHTAKLDGMKATLVTFGPGASVTEDAVESGYFPEGVEMCPLSHVAYVLEGALKIRQSDGSEETLAGVRPRVSSLAHSVSPRGRLLDGR